MRPERLGPYRILDLLGKGGLGVVYRALDDRTDEEVAVKLLTGTPAGDSRAALRFTREFESLALLDHPYVVKVIDAGIAGDMPYFAMELIDGVDIKRHLDLVTEDPSSWSSTSSPGVRLDDSFDRSFSGSFSGSAARAFNLEAWLEEPDSDVLLGHEPSDPGPVEVGSAGPAPSVDLPFADLAHPPEPYELPDFAAAADLTVLNGPMRVARLQEVLTQVCSGLAYVHSRGLVHRDLKPSNILVDVDGDARIMDFGLCKALADAAEVTDAGRVVGTYRYMAPEQAAGERVDQRADLYSLGVILYELLTGRPPFLARHPLDLWKELMETEPPPVASLNPGVDFHLARIAHELLRKDPADRLQTAEELGHALME